MKFLYINNLLCAGCDKCYESCPTKAIYHSEGKLYINYDKCVSCGNCFRECLHHAISIEKIEKVAREIESLVLNRSRMSELEQENAALREQISSLSVGLNTLIQKLPLGAIIINAEQTIISANNNFIQMLDLNAQEIAETRPHLSNIQITDALPPNICDMLTSASLGDNDIVNVISTLNKHNINISIYSIKKHSITLGIVSNIDIPQVANERTIITIKECIDRQMAMVQKLGFLLGEEVSEISKTLDSTIKIIDNVK